MCEGGEPGRCAIWKDERPGMMFQKALFRIRPHKELLPDFLYYYFVDTGRRNALSPFFTGSTIKHLPREKLSLVEVPLPPLSEQRRIVDILSAYDDLIENNRKRIALLEESARQLYKEWFVRLRFPGHERHPVEDGVPKGWKKTTIQDVCDILYGKAHANIPDGDIPVIGSGGIMRKASKALFSESSVLIPRKGSLGNVMLMEEPFWVVDTMFYTRMKCPHTARWLYFTLCDMRLEEQATGTAIPSMTTAILNPMRLRLPPQSLLARFDEWTNPVFAQCKTLRAESETLVAARDALLPRLMKGGVA